MLSQILENKLPSEATSFFTSSRLIALHKSSEDDLKLRPIAIGSALRRLICGHVSRVHCPYFAEVLVPYQWGIGVPNGLDFIYLTTSKLVEKYVSRSEEEMKHNPPSRALVQLDLKNMFNSVSRKKARQLIRLHFSHLIGLFDLMYKFPAKVWYQLPRGEWQHFLQIEGFPQGCPLSPFFAALVLHCILSEIDNDLRAKADFRRLNGDQGDDGAGSVTDIFALLDDTQSVVPYEDLLFLFRRFVELGAPLGCILAQGKCKILTSTCGISPRKYIKAEHGNNLDNALATYCGGPSGELLNGTRLLGYPLGNVAFVKSFLQASVNQLKASTEALN
ncbi:MAG: reverse transcriptase domain-containing protein, partial [Gloeomargaritales cyanobacterium]